MTHGSNFVEEPADEGAHWKCMQNVIEKTEKRESGKLRSGGERGRESRKKRDLKHQEDRDMWNGKREARSLFEYEGLYRAAARNLCVGRS